MVYSSLLSQFPWLSHGFGTRDDVPSAPHDSRADLKQIHSSVVLLAREPGCVGEGDALIASRPGLEVSVRTADCYPILLADARHRAVAAIHAGWRGTVAGIVGKALGQMHRAFGTESSDIYAAIGPGIGVCCFEVGPEVACQFDAACQFDVGTAARHINLAEENHRQLTGAGVAASRIDVSGLCTFCETGKFYSYRRAAKQGRRETGRMHSHAGIL